MVEPTSCDNLADMLAEVATGAASGPDRARVLSHLAGCDDCRRELEELTRVADEVLLVAPEHDPPAGFESAVLARIAALADADDAEAAGVDTRRPDAGDGRTRRPDAADSGTGRTEAADVETRHLDATDNGARRPDVTDGGAPASEAGRRPDTDAPEPPVVVPIRRRRAFRYIGMAAAAAVIGLGGAGVVWQSTADERELAAGYRETLTQANGKYFTAAPLLDTAGVQVGHVFLYQGEPSWLFTILSDAPEPGTYDVVVTTNDWTRTVDTCEVEVAGCGAGNTIDVDIRDVREIRLVSADGATVSTARRSRN